METQELAKLVAKKAFRPLSSIPIRVTVSTPKRLKYIQKHTTFHFILQTPDATSVQKTLAQVSTAEAFFKTAIWTWRIIDCATLTDPTYLTVKIDNAVFAKVMEWGDEEGFEEVVEAIRGAECWKEGKSGVCFVEVRRLICETVELNSRH